MSRSFLAAVLLTGMACPLFIATPVLAQETSDPAPHEHPTPTDEHAMWMTMLPGGWRLMGMAHVYPAATLGAPFSSDSPLRTTAFGFPHAAAMLNLESPDARWTMRFMPNFEGLTLADGEPTFGGWGEGFIDARHPHTVLHEAMFSFNWWEAPGGTFAISAGRGFAPYGTDDPMYRPALKYPTNHHLSQILERWTLNTAYVADVGWGFEVGLFDGNEPEDSWDMGNFRSFGNSWSMRASRWFGGVGPAAAWELSASYGRVRETHGIHEELTVLYNGALRHEAGYGFGRWYGLAEASLSEPEDGEGHFSLLAETQFEVGPDGRYRPFFRVEYATRPEYPRQAPQGEGFFRYDHEAEAVGATRWLINSIGLGYELTTLPMSVRPFVEASHNRVRHERGPDGLAPDVLFEGDSFWSLTLGARFFLGGGPMRMGRYGARQRPSFTSALAP